MEDILLLDTSGILTQLRLLHKEVSRIVDNIFSRDGVTDEDWKVAYDLIFSKRISRKVYLILEELGRKLDYYDPDTGYKEDVIAFKRALDREMHLLRYI